MDQSLHDVFLALERRPNPNQTLTSSGQLNKLVTAARRARCRRFTLVDVWQWLAPVPRLVIRPTPTFVVSRGGPEQKHAVHAVGSIHGASHQEWLADSVGSTESAVVKLAVRLRQSPRPSEDGDVVKFPPELGSNREEMYIDHYICVHLF